MSDEYLFIGNMEVVRKDRYDALQKRIAELEAQLADKERQMKYPQVNIKTYQCPNCKYAIQLVSWNEVDDGNEFKYHPPAEAK